MLKLLIIVTYVGYEMHLYRQTNIILLWLGLIQMNIERNFNAVCYAAGTRFF